MHEIILEEEKWSLLPDNFRAIAENPINYGYGVSDYGWPDYNSKFILELKTEVFATFKKSDSVNLSVGERILVRSTDECYIGKGNQVTLVEGRIVKLKHKVSNLGELTIPDSIYLKSSKLYNETLGFSFDF